MENLNDLLEDEVIDVVIIVILISIYVEMIIKVVENGKYIFVEKLLIFSFEEFKEVMKKIEEMGVICQVGFMRWFDLVYVDVKRRIDVGEIGNFIYYKGFMRD